MVLGCNKHDKEDKLHHFIEGLHNWARIDVEKKRPRTLSKAIQFAEVIRDYHEMIAKQEVSASDSIADWLGMIYDSTLLESRSPKKRDNFASKHFVCCLLTRSSLFILPSFLFSRVCHQSLTPSRLKRGSDTTCSKICFSVSYPRFLSLDRNNVLVRDRRIQGQKHSTMLKQHPQSYKKIVGVSHL